ncbi:hypothetical protein HNR42_003239 [Deinobacterium chartae]|uniref:Uncharacterized protein n=1 Tax=Deinobacterium chartae TaxID=521158 RepID=A0A841I1T7_9DEIO|nr:hypothetical protein [Deinobacterium chartae]MBB6099781.1 hypothetical protein [Deinobacterium chartae]
MADDPIEKNRRANDTQREDLQDLEPQPDDSGNEFTQEQALEGKDHQNVVDQPQIVRDMGTSNAIAQEVEDVSRGKDISKDQ